MIPRLARRALWGGRRSIHVEARIKDLGITLPPFPVPPQGSYAVYARTGDLLYLSGHLPMSSDGVLMRGKVGQDLTEEEGKAAARMVAINFLTTLKHELGDLDCVKQVVKLVGFVSCVDGFTGQPAVINGASDLLVEVFREKGVHARSAVGTNILPLNIPVEIEAIVEVQREEA
ncbi:unnamed protein product [Discosporangium mesarthrocarpum]